jgi:hypothetical protein
MAARSNIVLDSVLRVMQPLVRLLLRQGVSYPAFASALKRVFLAAAQQELEARGMAQTHSALTLLSGVHRRDVRTLLRAPPEGASASAQSAAPPFSLATQVIGRWMLDPAFQDADGKPKPLARGAAGDTFDALMASVSRDVRPRAMLDELIRLGAVSEDANTIKLLAGSFSPRQGFEEMSWLFADNLHDHASAAALNLQGEGNYLEQSIFVDQISEASAAELQQVSVQAWKQTFRSVMGAAQARFDHDAAQADPSARGHRARFGVYFFSDRVAGKK